MNNQDIDKAYVSLIDRFLHQYDADHPQSASQWREIRKHQRIAKLRDEAQPENAQKEIWEDF